MEIEFDPEKNDRNVRERGISFEQARDFDWDGALIWRDSRRDYSENGSLPWALPESGCTPWCSPFEGMRCE